MCSLLGKESLPAERSPQQTRNTELLGEHKPWYVHTHAHTFAEYTEESTCTSSAEKGEAMQKNTRSAQMFTCQ